MSDIKLFRYSGDNAEELSGRSALVERELHNLMEKHMECFLGIRFLAHEYGTGQNHRGRIDSLGLDQNNCPVIIEYKRHTNENVINQGLYYLDWLLDHRAEFQLLVMGRFGKEIADEIEWSGTRVLCVAGDFTKFDEHAVAQIGRNIELIRYKYFGDDLLLLEWVNPVQETKYSRNPPTESRQSSDIEDHIDSPAGTEENVTPFAKHFATMSPEMKMLYEELHSFIMPLGDDISVKELRLYQAFSRLKNFLSLLPMKQGLKVWLHINPDTVTLEKGFCRDVRNLGHWGTGDLEVYIRTKDDLVRAKPLIERAYQES